MCVYVRTYTGVYVRVCVSGLLRARARRPVRSTRLRPSRPRRRLVRGNGRATRGGSAPYYADSTPPPSRRHFATGPMGGATRAVRDPKRGRDDD